MKVAIPTFNSRVSPQFDFALSMLVVTANGGKVVNREIFSLTDLNPIKRVSFLKEKGVNVLICGGISDFSVRLLMGNKIEVFPMISGEVEDVLESFVNGHMDGFVRPITSQKRTGRRGRCRGRRKDFIRH